MSQELKSRILSQGHVILNSSPTRSKDTILSKITSYQSGLPGFSDHKNYPKHSKNQIFQNNSSQEYKNNVINHPLYIETYHDRDPNKITVNIQTIIQEIIEPVAHITKIQI